MIPKRGNIRDFRYSEKSQYYLASHAVTDISELEKPSLQGCDREVLYGKSPGLVVHHHLCTSDHIIKRNIMIKKEHLPLLDTCSLSRHFQSAPGSGTAKSNQIKSEQAMQVVSFFLPTSTTPVQKSPHKASHYCIHSQTATCSMSSGDVFQIG